MYITFGINNDCFRTMFVLDGKEGILYASFVNGDRRIVIKNLTGARGVTISYQKHKIYFSSAAG